MISFMPYPVRIEDIVVETEDGSLKTFKLAFEQERHRKDWQHVPGQFVMLSLAGAGEAPVGLASSPTEESLLCTVNRAGLVTSALHQLKVGDRLGLRGPLGNGFPLDGEMKGKNIVMIAGGFAVTILRAALMSVLARRQDYGRITFIYGAIVLTTCQH